MPFKISHRAYFWLRVFAVVFGIVMVVQLVRVNRPATSPSVAERPQVRYSQPGEIVAGRIVVPAGSFLSYPIKLNRKALVRGDYRTENLKGTIGCFVLDAGNFDAWREGKEFDPVLRTGNVPGGRVNASVSPGDYFFVIDNRHSPKEERVVELNIVLE